MITGHCSAGAHDDCPAPRSCGCPCGHAAGLVLAREDRAELIAARPIRGAVLPPKPEPRGDHLPERPTRPRRFGAEGNRVVARRTITDPAPELDGFPAGVFSLGPTGDALLHPPEEEPMPPADCPDCGEHFATGQGLGAHRRHKKCPTPGAGKARAASELRSETPAASPPETTPAVSITVDLLSLPPRKRTKLLELLASLA